jgi:hypothetical protein
VGEVPNPRIPWLQELLGRVHTAQGEIPNLDTPTASIGSGTAWTGKRALAVHDDTLAPQAKPFKAALSGMEGDVKSTISREPKMVSEEDAKKSQAEYGNR